MWPLGRQLRVTHPTRFLANGTHGVKERRRRNGDMQVCENASDR